MVREPRRRLLALGRGRIGEGKPVHDRLEVSILFDGAIAANDTERVTDAVDKKDAASHGVAGRESGFGLITHLALKHHEVAAAPDQRLSSENGGAESFGELRGQLGIWRNGTGRENNGDSILVCGRE